MKTAPSHVAVVFARFCETCESNFALAYRTYLCESEALSSSSLFPSFHRPNCRKSSLNLLLTPSRNEFQLRVPRSSLCSLFGYCRTDQQSKNSRMLSTQATFSRPVFSPPEKDWPRQKEASPNVLLVCLQASYTCHSLRRYVALPVARFVLHRAAASIQAREKQLSHVHLGQNRTESE